MTADDPIEVRAAGGLIRDEAGAVAVVHRPHYDDWTLPKGKLDPGESSEQAALREVVEETGLVCELGRELEPTRYVDHRGRRKEVRYWLMTVVGGAFAVNDEVDELRWLAPAEAVELLTFDRDRLLVAALDGGAG